MVGIWRRTTPDFTYVVRNMHSYQLKKYPERLGETKTNGGHPNRDYMGRLSNPDIIILTLPWWPLLISILVTKLGFITPWNSLKKSLHNPSASLSISSAGLTSMNLALLNANKVIKNFISKNLFLKSKFRIIKFQILNILAFHKAKFIYGLDYWLFINSRSWLLFKSDLKNDLDENIIETYASELYYEPWDGFELDFFELLVFLNL